MICYQAEDRRSRATYRTDDQEPHLGVAVCFMSSEVKPDYLHPLADYIRARECFQHGEKEEAARAIERAFGSEESNPFLRRNLDIALDVTHPAGMVVLDGIYGEMKWIQRKTPISRKCQE